MISLGWDGTLAARWSALLAACGADISPQAIHVSAGVGVEDSLVDALVGPGAPGEAGGVPAPALCAAVFERDVEVRLALGLDNQTGLVAQAGDEVGEVVAQGAVA